MIGKVLSRDRWDLMREFILNFKIVRSSRDRQNLNVISANLWSHLWILVFELWTINSANDQSVDIIAL